MRERTREKGKEGKSFLTNHIPLVNGYRLKGFNIVRIGCLRLVEGGILTEDMLAQPPFVRVLLKMPFITFFILLGIVVFIFHFNVFPAIICFFCALILIQTKCILYCVQCALCVYRGQESRQVIM